MLITSHAGVCAFRWGIRCPIRIPRSFGKILSRPGEKPDLEFFSSPPPFPQF